MQDDHFKGKAASYESVSYRVDNVDNIAQSILQRITFLPTMHIIDFGSGTGLLLENIAPYVRKVTAIDVSQSMNAQLAAKRDKIDADLEILPIDLATQDVDGEFDGIISSMTLHHIHDVESILQKLYSLVVKGGFIALADLDSEDGSFHTEETGVFHLGFDRNWIQQLAEKVGFIDVDIQTASIAHKPQGDYPVFLLTARK